MTLPIGAQMQICKVCRKRCDRFRTIGDSVMPRKRIFANIIVGGEVHPGDRIEITK